MRSRIEQRFGSQVRSLRQLGGGDVAEAYRVELADGRTLFAKTQAHRRRDVLDTEAAGLRWLRAPGAVAVPEVLDVGQDPPLLVLEWIEPGPRVPDPEAEAEFGAALAALHRVGAPCFGREDRRPTGSRSLPNEPASTWIEFYRDRRLLPLAELAEREAALGSGAIRSLRHVAGRLGELGGPDEPPARLHGDLWAGNRLVDRQGTSWLIDPAAHGGHREFDLAMMRLFGGFGDAAFRAYHEVQPLAEGWEERVALHQLAPLVVHAIKFGGGYVGAVQEALDRYS